MDYYHICTEGRKDNVIFKDDEDYVSAMNYIAISCVERKMNLLAFCVMSNHLHFILQSDYITAKKFIAIVKRRCSLKLGRKYAEKCIFSTKGHPNSIIKISDAEYLKSAIAYVLRNPLKHVGTFIWVYPWSSLEAYFNGKLYFKSQLNGNSKRKNSKILHSHFEASKTSLAINHAGYISPKEFVDFKQVESIFKTSRAMLYSLNKDKDAELEISMSSRKPVVSDNEILTKLPSILRNNFGVTSVDMIPIEQKLSLIETLRKLFNSSPKQIARILRIRPEILEF